jgi:hypothetical protein
VKTGVKESGDMGKGEWRQEGRKAETGGKKSEDRRKGE